MYSFWLFLVACILHLTSALDTELSERIVGGHFVTDLKQHPYMGFLVLTVNGDYERSCGATILSPKYILTAAHTVQNCTCGFQNCHCKTYTGEFILYTGSDVIDLKKNGSVLDKFHIHPRFNPYERYHRYECIINNDIAVGELKTPLVFSDYINKVQLPPAITKDQVNDTSVKNNQWAANKTQCKVLGWGDVLGGYYDLSPPQGRQLKSLNLTLISNELCQNYLFLSQKDFVLKIPSRNYYFCYNTQLCTIDPVFNSNSCHGDSGGPLICEGMQVGIIIRSINQYCVGMYHPQVYTRVDIHVPWINSFIEEDK